MKELKLSRLISDGMILQHGKKCRIWGWDEPGRKVTVTFMAEEYAAQTDTQGRWNVELTEQEPGGPYVMQIRDDAGEEKQIADILIGDVWFCSGQSNMELPMDRVKDQYPEEVENCTDSMIRTFKITEYSELHGPLEDVLTGEWKEAKPETILAFSATAYFFARAFRQMTGIPVGLINASLGGSPIEAWMSREMLEGYEECLRTADQYADAEFVKARLEQNVRQSEEWNANLNRLDQGLAEQWETEETDTSSWKPVSIPFFFRDTDLAGFIGSVWFRRTFTVPAKMAGTKARLWLGTIVDSDTVYLNGTKVGQTDYQYPPRKYTVPEGLLREGENTIVIRVKCEKGKGRFTDGKKYAVWNELGEIDLTGEWLYREAASCESPAETDFVNWKPTGLYHGMTAPCHNYAISGVLFYQGESNTHVTEPYFDLMKRMITGYRRQWRDENLPFYYVQLPNFAIDVYDSDTDETGHGWPDVREHQRRVLQLPGTGMTVSMDLGEDNDLHPLNKKDIGYRLALLAAAKVYGMDVEYTGPVAEYAEHTGLPTGEYGDGIGCCLSVRCSHAQGMYAAGTENGVLTNFEVADADGVYHKAQARVDGEVLRVVCGSVTHPTAVRYCYQNTARGGLIYNSAGLPMSPFILTVKVFPMIKGKSLN